MATPMVGTVLEIEVLIRTATCDNPPQREGTEEGAGKAYLEFDTKVGFISAPPSGMTQQRRQ